MKITAFLGIILLVTGVFCGCGPGKDYVSGLDDKLIQAERLEDQALCDSLKKAADAWALNQALEGKDAAALTWDGLKKELGQKYISYLEGLGEECFSDKALSSSIRDKGWIKVRQGWIIVSKGEGFSFTYSDVSPGS